MVLTAGSFCGRERSKLSKQLQGSFRLSVEADQFGGAPSGVMCGACSLCHRNAYSRGRARSFAAQIASSRAPGCRNILEGPAAGHRHSGRQWKRGRRWRQEAETCKILQVKGRIWKWHVSRRQAFIEALNHPNPKITAFFLDSCWPGSKSELAGSFGGRHLPSVMGDTGGFFYSPLPISPVP